MATENNNQQQEFKKLQSDVTKILNYLHNDAGTGELGLIAAFNKHEEKMDKFIREYEAKELVRKNNVRILALIFGSLSTVITTAVISIIEKYFYS